jgi:hypothetical protein
MNRPFGANLPGTQGATGRAKGLTQFGRALSDVNIDIILRQHASGEGSRRAHEQDAPGSFVKELRLGGISNMNNGNAFLPEFMREYNRSFARAPQSTHDAHRPL